MALPAAPGITGGSLQAFLAAPGNFSAFETNLANFNSAGTGNALTDSRNRGAALPLLLLTNTQINNGVGTGDQNQVLDFGATATGQKLVDAFDTVFKSGNIGQSLFKLYRQADIYARPEENLAAAINETFGAAAQFKADTARNLNRLAQNPILRMTATPEQLLSKAMSVALDDFKLALATVQIAYPGVIESFSSYNPYSGDTVGLARTPDRRVVGVAPQIGGARPEYLMRGRSVSGAKKARKAIGRG